MFLGIFLKVSIAFKWSVVILASFFSSISCPSPRLLDKSWFPLFLPIVVQPRARCLRRFPPAGDTLFLDVVARLLKVRVRFHATRLAGIRDLQVRCALHLANSA